MVCNKLRNVCTRCLLWQVFHCTAQHVLKPEALVSGTAPKPHLHSTVHSLLLELLCTNFACSVQRRGRSRTSPASLANNPPRPTMLMQSYYRRTQFTIAAWLCITQWTLNTEQQVNCADCSRVQKCQASCVVSTHHSAQTEKWCFWLTDCLVRWVWGATALTDLCWHISAAAQYFCVPVFFQLAKSLPCIVRVF